MERITVTQIEYVAFALTQERLFREEPMPDITVRFPNALENCLAVPFQSLNAKGPYPSFVEKAGILFYLMLKDRPFQNGNRRVAVTTLLYVLYRNKKWLKADTQTLYNFAVWVAASPSNAKEEVAQYIGKFIRKHMVAWQEKKA